MKCFWPVKIVVKSFELETKRLGIRNTAFVGHGTCGFYVFYTLLYGEEIVKEKKKRTGKERKLMKKEDKI